MTAAPQTVRAWLGPSAHRAERIAAADWERHRDEITRLYENMPLHTIREHMKKIHGFHPTSRQYVLQLGKWHLRKYRKGPIEEQQAASSVAAVQPHTDSEAIDTVASMNYDRNTTHLDEIDSESYLEHEQRLSKRRRLADAMPPTSQCGPQPADGIRVDRTIEIDRFTRQGSQSAWLQDLLQDFPYHVVEGWQQQYHVIQDTEPVQSSCPSHGDSSGDWSLRSSSSHDNETFRHDLAAEERLDVRKPRHPEDHWEGGNPVSLQVTRGVQDKVRSHAGEAKKHTRLQQAADIVNLALTMDMNLDVTSLPAQEFLKMRVAAELLSTIHESVAAFRLFALLLKRDMVDKNLDDVKRLRRTLIYCLDARTPAHCEIAQSLLKFSEAKIDSESLRFCELFLILVLKIQFHHIWGNSREKAALIEELYSFGTPAMILMSLPDNDRSLDAPVAAYIRYYSYAASSGYHLNILRVTLKTCFYHETWAALSATNMSLEHVYDDATKENLVRHVEFLRSWCLENLGSDEYTERFGHDVEPWSRIRSYDKATQRSVYCLSMFVFNWGILTDLEKASTSIEEIFSVRETLGYSISDFLMIICHSIYPRVSFGIRAMVPPENDFGDHDLENFHGAAIEMTWSSLWLDHDIVSKHTTSWFPDLSSIVGRDLTFDRNVLKQHDPQMCELSIQTSVVGGMAISKKKTQQATDTLRSSLKSADFSSFRRLGRTRKSSAKSHNLEAPSKFAKTSDMWSLTKTLSSLHLSSFVDLGEEDTKLIRGTSDM